MSILARLVLLTLSLLLAVPAARAAETPATPVRLRTAVHDGFGRMVFNWPMRVNFTAEVTDGRLVVSFPQAFRADLRPVERALGGYVGPGERSADERSVSFPLRRDVTVSAYHHLGTPVVDLLDPPTAGEAAGAGAPPVRIRTGEHPTYSRMVFDWPARVGYRVTRDGPTVTVTFDRPAEFLLPRRGGRPARRIGAVRAVERKSGTDIELTVAGTARVRHLRVGNRVVVDVFGPGKAGIAAARRSDRVAGAVDVPPHSGAATATTPAAKPEKAAAPDTEAAAEAEAEAAPEPEAAATATAAPEPEESAFPAASAPAADAATATLRFPWSEPVAAAVFRRGTRLWIAFDAPSRPNLHELTAAAGPLVTALDRVPVEQATVVRLRPADGVQAQVRRQGETWLVDLTRRRTGPDVAVAPEIDADRPTGPVVVLPESEPGEAIALTDPDAGDRILAVPLLAVGHGVAREYGYPQFRLLASVQGIALVPLSDELVVRTRKSGVEISTSGTLQVSQVSDAQRAAATLGETESLSRVFDPALLQPPAEGGFADQRQALLTAAAAAETPEAREAARLDLARFYLAQGFGTEALGILKLVSEDRPAAEAEAAYRLMRGMALHTMGRNAEAAAYLDHPSVDDTDEGRLWRAAALAGAGDLTGAAEGFRGSAALAKDYPPALRRPVLALAVESLATDGAPEAAKPLLDVLAAEPIDAVSLGLVDYLEGRWHEAAGDADAALAHYDQAATGGDRANRAKAELAAVNLRLANGEIDHAAAMEIYDRLRFEWRGDLMEFAVLRRLGTLAIEEGAYARGLRLLRSAATHFPEAPGIAEVTGTMTRTFEDLYLHDKADEMSPLSAIALFDEFRELTPAGDAGNEMIRRLADRLVSVDLLERAAVLLEDQVRVRLSGEEQTRVGARLALIYLLDEKPREALHALDESQVESEDADLVAQRRHLAARALLELGRHDDALAALGGDQSVDADRVRAELFWKTRAWHKAEGALARIAQVLGARAGEPLDERQARVVLKRAVALTLDGNETDLATLRTAYGQAMNATSYRDAFRLIAAGQTDPDAGLVDALDRGVAEVEGFQAFLAVYRDRVRREGLSAIN